MAPLIVASQQLGVTLLDRLRLLLPDSEEVAVAGHQLLVGDRREQLLRQRRTYLFDG